LQPTENVKELREIQKENYKEVFRWKIFMD
jgi:hypothetical protein